MKILPRLFNILPGDDSFEWILYLGPNVPQNAIMGHINENDELVYFANFKSNNSQLTKIFSSDGHVHDRSSRITLDECFIIKAFFECLKINFGFDFEFRE